MHCHDYFLMSKPMRTPLYFLLSSPMACMLALPLSSEATGLYYQRSGYVYSFLDNELKKVRVA